jgi:hypothetical protein
VQRRKENGVWDAQWAWVSSGEFLPMDFVSCHHSIQQSSGYKDASRVALVAFSSVPRAQMDLQLPVPKILSP